MKIDEISVLFDKETLKNLDLLQQTIKNMLKVLPLPTKKVC
jgi:hypothetical protein